MLHLKENISGIDVPIQDMQQDFYNLLIGKYKFTNVEGYGRLYRQERPEGFFPMWYNAATQSYEIVNLNTTKNIIFSFIDGQDHSTNDGFTFVAPVKVVFWFNLDALRAGQYEDAEAQRIVSSILKQDIATTFTYDRLQKGIRKIYNGFNIDDIKFSDKQPYHVFSLNINLTYQNKKC